MSNRRVGIIQHPEVLEYSGTAPFSPTRRGPEYPFRKQEGMKTEKPINGSVYEMVRELLLALRLDRLNFDTPSWNPLGAYIQPGQTVVIKPNWVRHIHDHKKDLWSVITHGSVIRAMLDYVYIALRGNGRIIIGDAPVRGCEKISH
jgi:uncharacterized protein (DUF362 family)